MSRLTQEERRDIQVAFKAQQPGPQKRPVPALDGNAVRALAQKALLDDKAPSARAEAVAVLAWCLPDPAVEDQLRGLMSDPHAEVRVLAAAALGLDDPEARQTLIAWVTSYSDHTDNSDQGVLDRIRVILKTGAPRLFDLWMGFRGLQPLRKALNNSVDYLVFELCLLGAGSVHAGPELAEWFSHSVWSDAITENLCGLLGGHRDPETLQCLLFTWNEMEEEDFDGSCVRLRVLEALERRQEVSVLPFLEAELKRLTEREEQELPSPLRGAISTLRAVAEGRETEPPARIYPRRLWGWDDRLEKKHHWSWFYSEPYPSPLPPGAPWTSPPTGPAAPSSRAMGWRWVSPPMPDPVDAPRGWEAAPVVATLSGYRVRWAGGDPTGASVRDLEHCSEERMDLDLLDEAPGVPFLLEGRVLGVWSGWMLGVVQTALDTSAPRSEVERWLSWLVAVHTAPHRAVRQHVEGPGDDAT